MPGVFGNGGADADVSGVLVSHHPIYLHFSVPDGVDMFHWSIG